MRTSVGSSRETPITVRDLRVDFYRGLALWMILWAHCLHFTAETYVSLRITPYYWFFSDALEMFVFLSGYAFGIAYARTYAQSGWWGCQVKAFNRIWQLYAVNMIVFVIVAAMVGAFARPGQTPYDYLADFFETPAAMLGLFLWLEYRPDLFNVLPLYMVILLPMPVLLAITHRSWRLALLISFAGWLIVRPFPWVNLPSYEHEGAMWFWNPFAWQFLFFSGILLARCFHIKGHSVPRHWFLVVVATAIVFFPVGWRVVTFLAARELMGLGGYYETLQTITFPYTQGKSVLAPLRLFHFFSLAYLGAVVLSRNHWFWSSWAARPLVLCGQSSLEVFAVGIILTYGVGVIWYGAWSSFAGQVVLNLAAIALSILAAVFFAYRRRILRKLEGPPVANRIP